MTEAGGWVEHGGGVKLYHLHGLERLGGVTAFFTGRHGGVSERWQGGLNWSYSVGDVAAQVRENRRRSLALAGVAPDRAVMAGLVHGDRVVAVTGDEPPGRDEVRLVPDCDGLITDRPGLALVVTAADCVPIWFYDPERGVVGVAHAGWRGTVAGIAGKTARAMSERYGCRPEAIHAAIGPSIGACCYEVDDAVVTPLRAHFGPEAEGLLTPGARPGKYQLDLWAANRLDLERASLVQIHVSGVCTSCGVSDLFSHRAEAGGAGRGAAIIVRSK